MIMIILKFLIGFGAVAALHALIYVLGRLSIGKQYGEDTEFVEVMIRGFLMILLITIAILLSKGCYMVGEVLIK